MTILMTIRMMRRMLEWAESDALMTRLMTKWVMTRVMRRMLEWAESDALMTRLKRVMTRVMRRILEWAESEALAKRSDCVVDASAAHPLNVPCAGRLRAALMTSLAAGRRDCEGGPAPGLRRPAVPAVRGGLFVRHGELWGFPGRPRQTVPNAALECRAVTLRRGGGQSRPRMGQSQRDMATEYTVSVLSHAPCLRFGFQSREAAERQRTLD